MGWLHKTKHTIEENEDEFEIEMENLDSLKNKINEQQKHLESISKKLEVVKGEYGEAISNLMTIKNEKMVNLQLNSMFTRDKLV